MDPISLMGLFSGIAGGIGALFNLGTADKAAQQTQQEETQLLNEAHQQQVQQAAEPGLVAQRTSQEQALHPTNAPWTGSDTILGDVAKENVAPQPKETTTLQPAMQLGV
jgi:hypothetical protein